MADHVRIVAFLGQWDRYKPRRYVHPATGIGPGKEACLPHQVWLELAMRLLAADPLLSRPDLLKEAGPLASASPDPQRLSIVFVGTEETYQSAFDGRKALVGDLRRWLGRPEAEALSMGFLEYDERALRGANAADADLQFWRLFQRLTGVLGFNGISDVEGFRHVQGERSRFGEAPSHILLDITHGFRGASFVAGAALDFALVAGRAGRVHDEPEGKPPRVAPAHHVLYAAADDEDDDAIVPVWDLTRFAAAARWGSALEAMMLYGRADDLSVLGREEDQRYAREALVRREVVRKVDQVWAGFGSAAKALADNIACNRWRDLMVGGQRGSARGMIDALASARASLETRMPILSSTLRRLEGWTSSLQAERIHSESGLQAIRHLAGIQERLQRFLELAATLREGLVTLYAVRTGRGEANGRDPGEKGFGDYRAALERALQSAGAREDDDSDKAAAAFTLAPPSGPWAENVPKEALALVSGVFENRNDLLHAGLRGNPLAAEALRKFFARSRKTFEELVEPKEVTGQYLIHPAVKQPEG